MASHYHTHDKRRVVNAIFKCFKLGVIAHVFGGVDQMKASETVVADMSLRYLPIIVQLKANADTIKARIEKRVHQMIDEMGGLEEIKLVFDTLPKPLSFDKGVLQSIGYKEFEAYHELLQADKEPDEHSLKQVIDDCKQKLIGSTIKYAKHQMKWLEKHL